MCARVYAITAALRLRCGQSASVDSLFMWFCYLAGNLTLGLQIHAQNIFGDVDVGVWSNCNIRNVIIIIVTFFLFLLLLPVVIIHPCPQHFSSGELGKNARQKTGPSPRKPSKTP
jgi:hypothetical protein